MKRILLLMCLSVAVSWVQKPMSVPVGICEGDGLTLRASAPDAVRYQWFKDGAPLAGAITESYTANAPGDYMVRCYAASGCASDPSAMIEVNWKKPLANNDQSTSSGQKVEIDVLRNDQSPCGGFDLTTLVLESDPSHGTVTIDSEGKISFTPVAGFLGTDKFTYSIRDKNGTITNVATVTIDVGSPLPVTLLFFTAQKNESEVLLLWETTHEVMAEKFVVERSPQGKDWTFIGETRARGGLGTKTSYQLTDKTPDEGKNYYRLKMVDKDGTFTYSKLVVLYFEPVSWVNIYPNPTEDRATVQIHKKGIKQLRITDASGKLLLTKPVVSSLVPLDLQTYPVGIYFIQLVEDTGRVYHFKIMKK